MSTTLSLLAPRGPHFRRRELRNQRGTGLETALGGSGEIRHPCGYLVAPTAAPQMSEETVVPIASSDDIVTARQLGRALGSTLGFAGADLTVIATAISELGRNIIEYATSGAIVMTI